jgi:pyrimidine-nucleoside phosphorylase
MRIVDIIEKKCAGQALTADEIRWFIERYTAGEIPDYQASALMMAIFFQGMNGQETVDLTLAMASSGDQLDLHDVAPVIVDKHSSGGVGDKTTLVVQPLVVACGVPVGKMSGRGLGSSGGTLDKMESFPGWTAEISLDQFKSQLREIGLVLAGQTADLAPADGKLYALRDVTGTVASAPLIAASIMSKKLAGGADAIVLDVKTGLGAFMPTVAEARELAEIMVRIGRDAGRRTVALITDMNQPLGHAVGNALEVQEAIATLRGGGPADFWAHCLDVAGYMLLLGGKCATIEEARSMIAEARADGRALEKFRQLVVAQGGDGGLVDAPERFPQARFIEAVRAPRGGFVATVDAKIIGLSCVHLGAGRRQKEDIIDFAVGMIVPTKVGDKVTTGQVLATVHANDEERLRQAQEDVLSAITFSDDPVEPLPHLYDTVQ